MIQQSKQLSFASHISRQPLTVIFHHFDNYSAGHSIIYCQDRVRSRELAVVEFRRRMRKWRDCRGIEEDWTSIEHTRHKEGRRLEFVVSFQLDLLPFVEVPVTLGREVLVGRKKLIRPSQILPCLYFALLPVFAHILLFLANNYGDVVLHRSKSKLTQN